MLCKAEEICGGRMEKLAIFGGKPTREKHIYYGTQYIDEDDIAAVAQTLRHRLITTGPQVAAAEEHLCKLAGAKYATLVSNGTAALHLACMALELQEGDEVITSPMTFAATSNAVLYCGGTVVFADIDPETYNISPAEIEKKITRKTKAIIGVDFTGQAVDVEAIRRICDKYNLVFIEDAAHSIGTCYNGKPVGSLADMTCFSFHPVKTLTAGEGGAVTTNSEKYFKKVSSCRTHGIVREEEDFIEESHGRWYHEQLELGYNYRITDFQAALLNSQMNKLDLFAARRKEIVKLYNKAFKDMRELVLQKNMPFSDTVNHLYILQLNLELLNCTRKEFFDAMDMERVVCQVHYIPVYLHPYYQKLGYEKGLCPNAEYVYERILSIPLYYGLTDEDVNDVIHAVKKVVAYYSKV